MFGVEHVVIVASQAEELRELRIGRGGDYAKGWLTSFEFKFEAIFLDEHVGNWLIGKLVISGLTSNNPVFL
jgi:hypothetical protein